MEELRFVADVDKAEDAGVAAASAASGSGSTSAASGEAAAATAASVGVPAAAPEERIKTVGFVGAGADSTKKVTEGGWSNRFFCRSSKDSGAAEGEDQTSTERVCGFQTRTGGIGEDGLGVTDLRVYCCKALQQTLVGFYVVENAV